MTQQKAESLWSSLPGLSHIESPSQRSRASSITRDSNSKICWAFSPRDTRVCTLWQSQTDWPTTLPSTFYLLCIKCFQYFPQSSVGHDHHLTTPATGCWNCQLSLNISACEYTNWWASSVDLKDFYAFMRLHLFTLFKLNLEFLQWAYIFWMQMHIKIIINIILREKSGKILMLDILFIPPKTFI